MPVVRGAVPPIACVHHPYAVLPCPRLTRQQHTRFVRFEGHAVDGGRGRRPHRHRVAAHAIDGHEQRVGRLAARRRTQDDARQVERHHQQHHDTDNEGQNRGAPYRHPAPIHGGEGAPLFQHIIERTGTTGRDPGKKEMTTAEVRLDGLQYMDVRSALLLNKEVSATLGVLVAPDGHWQLRVQRVLQPAEKGTDVLAEMTEFFKAHKIRALQRRVNHTFAEVHRVQNTAFFEFVVVFPVETYEQMRALKETGPKHDVQWWGAHTGEFVVMGVLQFRNCDGAEAMQRFTRWMTDVQGAGLKRWLRMERYTVELM